MKPIKMSEVISEIVRLRESEKMPLYKIASNLGVLRSEVERIYLDKKREDMFSGEHPEMMFLRGLSTRLQNVLMREGINTKKEALDAVTSRKLIPEFSGRVVGYGAVMHRELLGHLGIEPKLCPHCEKPIK